MGKGGDIRKLERYANSYDRVSLMQKKVLLPVAQYSITKCKLKACWRKNRGIESPSGKGPWWL